MTEHRHGPDGPTLAPDGPVEPGPAVPGTPAAGAEPYDDRDGVSPAQLTRAREARNWSIADVASRLRMQKRQIEAIEAGRWSDLPGTAFVRGAIRAYARLLELDPAPLLATVGQLDTGLDLRARGAGRGPVAVAPGGLYSEPSGIGRWGLGLLGLIAVIAIAIFFAPGTEMRWATQFLDDADVSDAGGAPATAPTAGTGPGPADTGAGGPSDDAVAAAARAASALLGQRSETDAPGSAGTPRGDRAETGIADDDRAASGVATDERAADRSAPAAASDPAGAGAIAPRTGTAPAASGTATEPGATADGPVSAPGATASPTRPAAAPGDDPAASAASLTMRFTDECWVEVTDAGGRRLVYGLQKPRSRLALDVPGPVTILVGNADAVELTRGGRPVDVVAASRDGVARMRLE